jgi:surfactin synthase thioesterase subunit
MRAWDSVTTGGYTMFTVPGDHAFIEKDQSEARVLELLQKEIHDRFRV